MSFRSWFASEAAAPEPPYRDDTCSCGCGEFTAGGHSVHVQSNGVRARIVPSGAVLSCLACGKRWYETATGLREPHRDAMPATWAARDLQREASEKLSERAAGTPPTPRRDAPRPHLADVHRQPLRG